MTFRDDVIRIFKEYPKAMSDPFKGHPFAYFLRHDFSKSLMNLCDLHERYKWQGITRQGKWSASPWFALLDILIANTADSGYYPVYLFREDFSGFYLSLNQGVAEMSEKYGFAGKEALRGRAADFRTQIKGLTDNFREVAIELRPSAVSNLTSFYEAGNICAKFYDVGSLPANEELISDFKEMLQLHAVLSYTRTVIVGINDREEDETSHESVEDLRNFRQHKRIERNADLVQAVRRLNGHTCKLCGFGYEKIFGAIGKAYIEPHHLMPISELQGENLLLDPQKHFAVLCPNCHRMIHKAKNPHDISAFKTNHFRDFGWNVS